MRHTPHTLLRPGLTLGFLLGNRTPLLSVGTDPSPWLMPQLRTYSACPGPDHRLRCTS